MIDLLSTVRVPGEPVQIIFFIVVAALCVFGAVGVVVARDPFVSALSLIVNFAGLGTLYLSLHAPFVAVAQVIVYAGAVVVLFLFVIAYLGDRRELVAGNRDTAWFVPVSIIGALALLGMIVAVVWNGFGSHTIPGFPNHVADSFGSVASVGQLLVTRYTLEFETVSFVLLVAAIGGVTLGLTGRSRHTRLRHELGTLSSDQQRRRFEHDDPDAAEYERRRASREIASAELRSRLAETQSDKAEV